MKKKTTKVKSGFVLLEILIGVAVFVLIAGALTLFSRNVWIFNSFLGSKLANVASGKQIIKSFSAEVRSASAADTGAYTIGQAAASSFTFYSNIDSDGLKEKVRYFLNGTTLQKGVIKPTGSPLTYNPANETISTLATAVTNTSIFSYYDKNYDGTSAPLATPVNIPSIRLVKITVTLDQDQNRSPTPMTFSTQVSVRNLKDNL